MEIRFLEKSKSFSCAKTFKKLISPSSVFSNFTTVVSVFAGAAFLDEKLTFQAVISTIMIVVGVWGVQILNVTKKV